MGKRGFPPAPTALKVLRGNPGHQKLDREEPKPQPVAPKCPAWIPPAGKRLWRDLGPKLEALGLLTEVDQVDFAVLCAAVADYIAARAVIDEKGPVSTYGEEKDPDTGAIIKAGFSQQRPEVGIVHRNTEIIHRYGAKFGLSPADRVGLGVTRKDDEDEFDRFQKQKTRSKT